MHTIYIIFILSFSILTILATLHNISGYKFSIIEKVLLFLSIIISYFILYLININLASISTYIIPIIFIYIRNNKLLKSIFIQAITCIIIIFSDNIITLIIIKCISEDFTRTTYGYIITSLLILILAYSISKLLSIIIKKYGSLITEYSKSKYSILIYVMVILTLGVFYININWNISDDATYLAQINGILFLIYGALMIIITAILLFILKKDQNFKIKEMQMNNLQEYTYNLECLYMDMRKFRHDYINIISSMADFIESKDIEGLAKHFTEHIYPLNTEMNKNNYKLGLLKNILMPEIKGLLSAKIIRAQELGVDVILEIVEPIDKINLDIIDLNRCLGIILDNAIEATLPSEEKKLHIAFIKKNSSIFIVVSNTFEGKIPPLSKIFKAGFSTKGKNRGLGLSNLKDIMNKYSNATLDTYIEDNRFTQNITISNY
ncbi:putative membrane protein [Clostridium bornimense]|uniref:Putative membrane protein n=1 Tax=Clostridium bornimense TaxID=1216932 RepID=W6S380_9CLOT|nr:GHKL domain-containing protein [Clostridium bornimense]CDM70374.1 putative membrane protein [Clostridium bornimense]